MGEAKKNVAGRRAQGDYGEKGNIDN